MSPAIDLARAISEGQSGFRRLHRQALHIKGAPIDALDFSESTLTRFDVESSAITHCDFGHSWISDATVSAATFRNCRFDGTVFERARFSGVTFDECHLSYVGLTQAQLENVAFVGCVMRDVFLNDARAVRCAFVNSDAAFGRLGGAVLLDSDLSALCDSSGLRFGVGSILDWRSIARSARAINLEAFLVGTGMPELFAAYNADCARALNVDFLLKRMRSTFISYGAPDADFAVQLRNRLRHSGVDVYIFAVDAIPGERLSDLMYQAVNKYDRIIVICTEASLQRAGVRNEIREALAREARDGGASYVIPIARDDYLFDSDEALARRLRDRVAADFRPKRDDQGRLKDDTSAMISLLRALSHERPERSRSGA